MLQVCNFYCLKRDVLKCALTATVKSPLHSIVYNYSCAQSRVKLVFSFFSSRHLEYIQAAGSAISSNSSK